MPRFPAELLTKLDARQATGEPLHLFFRDDDVDDDENSLRRLLTLFLPRGVPLCLGVIPGRLTAPGREILAQSRASAPALVELAQHGWMHVNHETTGRKCEFGPSRTLSEQLADIDRGRERLTEAFGEAFSPIFIPPWNRCTEQTGEALDRLGFQILSRLRGESPLSGYRFRELSVSLDLYRWRGGATLKSAEEIGRELAAQLERPAPIGVMLHHQVMDDEAFAFVEELLETLARYRVVRYHSLETLRQIVVGRGEAGR